MRILGRSKNNSLLRDALLTQAAQNSHDLSQGTSGLKKTCKATRYHKQESAEIQTAVSDLQDLQIIELDIKEVK